MQPEMYSCCKMQPSWIFIYENEQVYSICDVHFESENYRLFVKFVINMKTRKCYLPSEILGGILA